MMAWELMDTLDERIDLRPPFPLSWGYESGPLIASIRAVGLVSPLVVWKNQDRLSLVCGVRRRSALKTLGIESFPARVLPEGVGPRQAFLIALEDNLGTRTLNDAEKVLAVDHLRLFFEAEEIVKDYLPRLGLPPRPEFFQRYVSLIRLGPSGLDALASGRLDPETGERLLSLDPEDRRRVIDLLEHLAPGRNKRREIVAWLEEIGRREQKSQADLIEDHEIQNVLRSDRLNRPQKEAEVRRILKLRRYPELGRLQRLQAEWLKKLDLPSQVRLDIPEGFEGLSMALNIVFSNPDELSQGLEAGRDLLQTEALARLMDLG